jgi:hypothetical protein
MEPRASLTLVNTLCAWASGASVLIAQAAVWLSTGVWPQWRLGDGWALIGISEPLIGPGPVGGIFQWVWSWPLGVGVFVLTAILAALIDPSRRD